MQENEIIICGHGSGCPTTKNMANYLESRYQQKASNGVRKGLVAIRRRRGLTDTQRQKWHDTFATTIGRNIYSQAKRTHALAPYSDGRYYSDCSGIGDACWTAAGAPTPWHNTEWIYRDDELFEDVPAVIEAGHVKNPEVLQVADALLFAGNDPSRPRQIGHVEYVYELPREYPYWLRESGTWFYRTGPGQNAHGWRLINRHWYYFDTQGRMLTGIQVIGGERYYLEESGQFEGACCQTDERGVLKIWDV